MRRVPLARRNLLADRRRLAASAAGVGFALMLVLLIDGLWAGVKSQVTLYEDRVGADLYVVAPGARNLFAEAGAIPISTVETARRTPGVDWAAPVRGQFAILELHDRKVAVTLVGSVPGEEGGPWALREGRVPRADDEVVIDEVLADRHGLDLGSTFELLGREFRVVGESSGTAAFMTGFVFVTHAATDALLRAPDTTSFVLVGTDRPGPVSERLARQGLTALDRQELRDSSLQLATRIYGVPIRLMVGVAFAAGTLVIALTVYAAIVERRREYGIVKALGATAGRLFVVTLGQTLGLALIGFATGLVLFAGGRWVITAARPQFVILLTAGGLVRVAVAAAAMAVLAAIVPARRLARLDPAAAYRGE